MRWEGQTEEEKQAQYTGFSVVSGHVGYLREAYHGSPYVIQWLVPESFAARDGEVGKADFQGGHDVARALFATLANTPGVTLDRPSDPGEHFDSPPEGYMIKVELVPDDGDFGARIPAEIMLQRLPLCEAIFEQRSKRVYNEEPDPNVWAAFTNFVALACQLEDAGKKPYVYTSH